MVTELEQTLIKRALRFTAAGPLFPEWEFHTLFGLTRNEMLALAEASLQEPVSEQLALAVNGALNNLLGYPHGKPALVVAEVGPIEQLEALGQAWRELHPPV